MNESTRRPIGWLPCLALGAILCAPLLVLACGEDESATPDCSDLPLFDVRELMTDAASAETKAAYAAWQTEAARGGGCVTGAGTATSGDAAAAGD
jgi:hypothetical protein